MAKQIEKGKSVGERLLLLRNKNGLTQEELAEQLDVSRQSISKWELNKTLPDVEKLIQLSEIYQVSIDYLIKGKEERIDTETQEEKLQEEKLQQEQVSEKEETVQAENEKAERKIAGNNKEFTVKQAVILICILLSGFLCLCMLFVTGRLLLTHTFQRKEKEQDVIQVEKIYEQYTKAQVTRWSAQNEAFFSEIVWLDIPGVRENDFVFCYLDEEEGVSFEHYIKTLLLPAVFGIIFLMFLIVFLIEFRDLVKKKRHARGRANADIANDKVQQT